MGYIVSIKTAIFVFPVLAFLITVPYMIFNYRKYGSVNKLRTLILYSFVLYLLTIYLLVILPLPNLESIRTTYTDMLNLIPFSFAMDFIKDSPFTLSSPATWVMALKHPSFYVPAFNVLMLIPFGIFELTQLSGLYFIYPGPYRLSDIDDIIQNTTGGCLGYTLGWFAVKLLPSREKIDEKALEAGSRVSEIRICLSLMIDILIIYIPYMISKTTLPLFLFIALYFSLIPLFNGKTFGSALLKFGIEFENAKWIRTILRGILLTGYFYLIPLGLLYIMNEFNKYADSLLFICLFATAALILLLYAIITVAVVLLNRRLLFDRLSGAGYKSTVLND